MRFSVWDFDNTQEPNWPVSLIFVERGNIKYKAYIRLQAGALMKDNLLQPNGLETFFSALDNADEYYVDTDGTVKKANSFRKCFRKTAKDCPGFCSAAVTVCGAATTVIATASGGIGLGAAIALFAGCAGGLCATCLATAAFSCL